MSILVKNMEMPAKCGACNLFHAESPMHCMAIKEHKTPAAPYGLPRPDWCPLEEQQEERWIPCNERLPEEDHWLGGSGRQFSDEILVSVANCDDEDTWTYISQTIDGNWALELPRHCEIVAWMPLPEPYREEGENR